MNEENVNPENVNPHFEHPEKFGLYPSHTVQPCPSCGHCPTCGRGPGITYYGPWWGWNPNTAPIYTISCTTTGGEGTTVHFKPTTI